MSARVVMVVCEVVVVRAAMVVPGSEDHGSNGVTSASVCSGSKKQWQ